MHRIEMSISMVLCEMYIAVDDGSGNSSH
jgi:hypothetical protein